jgi:ligand-binding SRPBCC domain-containing protein
VHHFERALDAPRLRLTLPFVKMHEFTAEIWLPQPPEVVFPFFGDAANLDAITPPWLDFKVITPPPIVMRAGTLIDYRLRLRGFPLRWRTHISVWEPPFRFVDEQLRGPYRLWVHEHTFVASKGGTLARDYIRYAVPFDWLAHRWLVRPDIERIFAHRLCALEQHFKQSVNVADRPAGQAE